MTDIVSKSIRSKMMSNIRCKDTKPELMIRKGLFKHGFRFRIHQNLPGKPDLVFKKYNALIFVNGCFWHRHLCTSFKWPNTNNDFWKKKLNNNVIRDKLNISILRNMGWRVCIVWECSIKNNLNNTLTTIIDWLLGSVLLMEV